VVDIGYSHSSEAYRARGLVRHAVLPDPQKCVCSWPSVSDHAYPGMPDRPRSDAAMSRSCPNSAFDDPSDADLRSSAAVDDYREGLRSAGGVTDWRFL